MSSSNESNLGLYFDWDYSEDGWNTGMDNNMVLLGGMACLSVKDRTLTTPPASPTNGAVYYVPSGSSGVWASTSDQIAIWSSDKSSWYYSDVKIGWQFRVENETGSDGNMMSVYYDGSNLVESVDLSDFVTLSGTNSFTNTNNFSFSLTYSGSSADGSNEVATEGYVDNTISGFGYASLTDTQTFTGANTFTQTISGVDGVADSDLATVSQVNSATGTSTYVGLTDTPTGYGIDGQVATTDGSGVITWETNAAGVTEYLNLTDTQNDYGTDGQVATTDGAGSITWETNPVGVTEYLNLTDTQNDYGTDGQVATTDGAGSITWEDASGGGASTYVELTDTEAGYGTDGQVATTNGTDAITWVDAPKGLEEWNNPAVVGDVTQLVIDQVESPNATVDYVANVSETYDAVDSGGAVVAYCECEYNAPIDGSKIGISLDLTQIVPTNGSAIQVMFYNGNPFSGDPAPTWGVGTYVNFESSSETITSLTRSGTTVTAVGGQTYNMADGEDYTISDSTTSEFNGTFTVTVVDYQTFTYELGSAAGADDLSGAASVDTSTTYIAAGDFMGLGWASTNPTYNNQVGSTSYYAGMTLTFWYSILDNGDSTYTVESGIINEADDSSLVLWTEPAATSIDFVIPAIYCYEANTNLQFVRSLNSAATGVEQFTDGVLIDDTQYPSGSTDAQYYITGWADDLVVESDAGSLMNGSMVGFNANGELASRSALSDFAVDEGYSYDWTGSHLFEGAVEHTNAQLNQVRLENDESDGYEMVANHRYQWNFNGNGSTSTTATIPGAHDDDSEPYIELQTIGRTDYDLTITSTDNNDFFQDGLSVGTSVNLSGENFYRFQSAYVDTSGAAQSGNWSIRWNIIDLAASGGGSSNTIGDETNYVTVDTDNGDIDSNAAANTTASSGTSSTQEIVGGNNWQLTMADASGIRLRDNLSGNHSLVVDNNLGVHLSSTLAVAVGQQTTAMTGGDPDLYVATKKYVDENSGGLSDTDLVDYTSSAGISLKTANNYSMALWASGTSGSGNISLNAYFTDIKRRDGAAADPRLRFFDDSDSYSGVIYPNGSGGLRFEDLTSASYIDLDTAITLNSATGNDITLTSDTNINLDGTDNLVNADPTEDLGIATKQYVDNLAGIKFELAQSPGTTEITGVDSRLAISAMTDELIALKDYTLEVIRTYQVTADGLTQVGSSYDVLIKSNNSNVNALCSLSSTRVVSVFDTSGLGDCGLQTLDWDGSSWTTVGSTSGIGSRESFFMLTKLTETTVCCVYGGIGSYDMAHLSFDGTNWSLTSEIPLSDFYSTKSSLATLNETTVAMYYGGDGIDDQYRVYEWSGSSWSLSYAVDTDVTYSRGLTQQGTDYVIYNEGRTDTSLIKYYWNGTTLGQVSDPVPGTSSSPVLAMTSLNDVTVQTINTTTDNSYLYQFKNDATRNSVFDLYYSDEDFKIFSQNDISFNGNSISVSQDPATALEVATKQYVDNASGGGDAETYIEYDTDNNAIILHANTDNTGTADAFDYGGGENAFGMREGMFIQFQDTDNAVRGNIQGKTSSSLDIYAEETLILNAATAVEVAIDPTTDSGVATKKYVDGLQYNLQTGTTYTVLSSDDGSVIEFTNAADITVTIPDGLGAGFNFVALQGGAGKVIWSGTSVNNVDTHTQTRGQYSTVAFMSVVDDVYYAAGATE